MRHIWSKGALVLGLSLLAGCDKQSENATQEAQPSQVAMANVQKHTSPHGLSAQAAEGQKLFATCDACHNVALDPPKAPPMYGVQRRYKRTYSDKESFVQAVVDFVQKPSQDKVVMRRPAMKMGLMPPLPLPDDQLVKIATYIYEFPFPPPCEHWAIAIKNAEAAGEVDDHIEHDKMKLQQFCK